MNADRYAKDFCGEDDDTYTWDSATGERTAKKHTENFVEMLTDTEFFTISQALGWSRLEADDKETSRLEAVENARAAIEKWFSSRPEHRTNLRTTLENAHI